MINDDNAVTRVAAAVARIGGHQWPVRLTPTMEVLLASVAEIAGTEATPENAESLVEEFGGAARMLGAVLRNTDLTSSDVRRGLSDSNSATTPLTCGAAVLVPTLLS